MGWLSIAVAVYALAVAAGGLMGYLRAGSPQSLMAGGTAGLLLLAAAIVSRSNPRLGFGAATVLAIGLLGMFVYRYMQTRSPMPALGVIGLSLVMLILLVVGHFMNRPTTG